MQLHHAIVITAELRATLDEARSGLNRRLDIDRAVAANQEALSAAEAMLEEMKASVGEFDAAAIHAEAAASIDPLKKPEVAKAIKAADRAANELAEKQREIERRTAAQGVLNESARVADEAIAAAKSKMTTASTAFRGQLQEAFAADLIEACKPLADVLRAAREIHDALPNGFCRQLLENTKVLDPRSFRVVSTDSSDKIAGTDLLVDDHPSAETPPDARLALREIAEVGRALAAHRAFVPAAKSVAKKPYRVKGSPVTEQKQRASSRGNETEWAPPASTWQPQTWGLGNNGGRRSTGRAATEINVSAALAESDRGVAG